MSVVPAIRLASVTVLQHSFAYDYELATAEANKLFQPRRDLFAGASLLDQGSKQPPKKFKGQAMKATKRSAAENVSRPPRSDLVDYERRLIDEKKWHFEQASTKLDVLSKLKIK